MLEETSSFVPRAAPADDLGTLPCAPEPAVLDAEWRRCRRQAHHLGLVEAGLMVLALGVLLAVALCGVVAITHEAIESGDVGLPLGLGLALTMAFVLVGLAFRAREGRTLLIEHLVRLECARRAVRRDAPQPYRTAAYVTDARCTHCLFHELHSDLRAHAMAR